MTSSQPTAHTVTTITVLNSGLGRLVNLVVAAAGRDAERHVQERGGRVWTRRPRAASVAVDVQERNE